MEMSKFEKYIKGALYILLCLVALSILLISFVGKHIFDDGPLENKKTLLYVDQDTGCEFISASGNTIIKRMDGNGNQLGCHKKEE